MLNYIRTDLRRMVRSRSFLATLLLLVAFTTMVYVFLQFSLSQPIENIQTEKAVITFTNEAGEMAVLTADNHAEYLESARKAANPAQAFQGLTTSPPVTAILFAVFFALFVSQDFQTGYIKNIMAQKGVRGKWIVGKASVAVVYSLIQYAVLLGCAFLGAKLIGASTVVEWTELLPRVALLTLYSTGFAAIMCLIAVFTRSGTATMAIGILIGLNLQAFFYNAIDKLSLLPFKLMEFGMFTQLPFVFITPMDLWQKRLIVVPAAVLLIGFTAAYLIFRKKDIHV